MIPYDFTHKAERQLFKLPHHIQHKIIHKIEYYLNQPNPLSCAKRIAGSPKLSFRFRVDDYRVIFDWEGRSILITRVGHRSDVYRL